MWLHFRDFHLYEERQIRMSNSVGPFTIGNPIVIGEVSEVNCSSFTNTLTFLTSSDIITIYVPRAFQRAAPRPLILQHVQKHKLLVRVERFRAIFDIRICRSSLVRQPVKKR